MKACIWDSWRTQNRWLLRASGAFTLFHSMLLRCSSRYFLQFSPLRWKTKLFLPTAWRLCFGSKVMSFCYFRRRSEVVSYLKFQRRILSFFAYLCEWMSGCCYSFRIFCILPTAFLLTWVCFHYLRKQWDEPSLPYTLPISKNCLWFYCLKG